MRTAGDLKNWTQRIFVFCIRANNRALFTEDNRASTKPIIGKKCVGSLSPQVVEDVDNEEGERADIYEEVVNSWRKTHFF